MLHITQIKKQTRAAALDYQQLYAAGLSHINTLAKRIWTDYNTHDPGITILELLCYALTDLSYRTSLPIADLLASADDNAANMRQQFFSARQILPNRALTLSDYRKLLIDLLGVKNAWLRPATQTYFADTIEGKLAATNSGFPGVVAFDLQGLYDVTIEYMDDITTVDERDAVLKAVRACLQANRNLCEDFIAIAAVAEQPFILCSEIEIAPDRDAAQIEAQILFEVQQYLAPPVRNYSLSEMLARQKSDGTHYSADEIFDGPALQCGFIDDAELAAADLRTQIRLSDIISLIMDIPGVVAVRDIVVNPDGISAPVPNKWLVDVAAQHKATLDRDKSRIVVYKRNMPTTPNPARVATLYQALADAERAKEETPAIYDFAIPQGQYRDASAYYSMQNDFPALYGLSEVGLSENADETRRAQAYQLKAYVLFFDQLMANYFAQIGHVKDLFSTDPNLRRTYFYQMVTTFADFDKIYSVADIAATIQTKIEDAAILDERRNRFLDHLIARFAEQFSELAHVMYSAFASKPETLIAYKADFLRVYPAVSADRGGAYNYTLQGDADLWNSDNISGLERRLTALLGIGNNQRRNLGDVAYDIYAEIDGNPTDEFRFRIRKKDTGKIVLSSSTKYTTPDLARAEMRRAIYFAQLPSGYQRLTTGDGRFYFNIIDDSNAVIARRIEYFATDALMQNAIDELVQYLHINYSDEGLYVIENLLLRPQQADDPFLPICPDPNCNDCPDNDPYSYRLHIILPAYGARFSNMEFRQFAEALIRAEVPAHILPKICWISAEDMAVLEKCYRDWIYLQSGRDSADRQDKLKKFIGILYTAKNVYPPAALHECDADESLQKFILGQTILGSKPSSGS